MFRNLISKWFNKKQQVKVQGWTKEQEAELAELFQARVPKTRIMEITGRSLNSINYKLTQMFKSSSVAVLNSKDVAVV